MNEKQMRRNYIAVYKFSDKITRSGSPAAYLFQGFVRLLLAQPASHRCGRVLPLGGFSQLQDNQSACFQLCKAYLKPEHRTNRGLSSLGAGREGCFYVLRVMCFGVLRPTYPQRI